MEKQIIESLNRIEKYSILAAKEMLTTDELSFLTGLSQAWIYNATCKKIIPHYKPNGKLLYFNRHEIEEWLMQNRIATSDEINRAADQYILNNTGVRGHKRGAKQ